jgi:hypothetical protein
MGSLLRPVAADCHAAPASGAPVRRIEKQKRALFAFAYSHQGKIFRTDKVSHRLGDWQKYGVGGSPTPESTELESRWSLAIGRPSRSRHNRPVSPHRAQVPDLMVPATSALWQSGDGPCERERNRETILSGRALERPLRRVQGWTRRVLTVFSTPFIRPNLKALAWG